MKLFNSIGPNPQIVRMFANQKGIELAMEDVDIVAGENRQAAYLAKNPSGTCPALQLDDGSIISEVTAICEYLDELNPGNSLIGSTPEERAETRMWTRTIDLGICEPMANGFRYSEGLKMFQDRIHCIPAAADDLKAIAAKKLEWLDKQMEGKQYLCGSRLSLADIVLYCVVSFFANMGQPLNPDLKNVGAWFERMAGLPSAGA